MIKSSVIPLVWVIVLTSWILLIGGNSMARVIPPIASGKYFQEVKTEIKLPVQSEKNVLKLFRYQNVLIAASSNGVFRYLNGEWSGDAFGQNWRTATLDPKGVVWLASEKFILGERAVSGFNLPDNCLKDTILSLMWEDEKTLYVGTSNGLLIYNGTWTTLAAAEGKRVNSILEDKHGDLWVATNQGLLRRMDGKWLNMDDLLMANSWKRSYFSLENDPGKSEVLFGGNYAVGAIADDGNHWILRGADGLPFGPATTIRSFGGVLWLGTGHGAIRKDSTWHYYNDKRWLPDNKVNDILPVDQHTVWIATPEGISEIREVEMTLSQKAAAFEERIKLRHDRYGLVNSSFLRIPGDLSTNQKVNEDNDGLWTSLYLATECFRYAVTKDPEARKNAIKTYEAMERLETATGIPGFPARSFVAAGDSITKSHSPFPREWHLSADGKWKWLGDTSSDEIVGHMFAYPLFYELVAEGELKVRVKSLVQRIMDHIVDHNFLLIDLDGKPTKWGIWTPDSLNYATFRWYERGLNSLQILSFLQTAVYVTGDQKFKKAYNDLVEKHHYAQNVAEVKMYGPYENSHSDDILAFLPYYNLFRYTKEDKWFPYYLQGLQKCWQIAAPDRIPAWNVFASTALKNDCNLWIAISGLRNIPMDMVEWTMENSHRWDLQKDQLIDRSGQVQATIPIPAPEGSIPGWNRNPRQLNSGSNGKYENDGTYFLLPYWMGRFYGYFTE